MDILGVRLCRQIDLEAFAELGHVKFPFVFLPGQEVIVESLVLPLRRLAADQVHAADLHVGVSLIHGRDDEGACRVSFCFPRELRDGGWQRYEDGDTDPHNGPQSDKSDGEWPRYFSDDEPISLFVGRSLKLAQSQSQ